MWCFIFLLLFLWIMHFFEGRLRIQVICNRIGKTVFSAYLELTLWKTQAESTAFRKLSAVSWSSVTESTN